MKRALLPGLVRLSGDGVFFTIQGEGLTAGLPAIFLRGHECNLKCDWSARGGEICDAWYTWKEDTDEYLFESVEHRTHELASMLVKSIEVHKCSRIVLTGGEPMMQRNQLDEMATEVDLILYCNGEQYVNWEVETNGTIPPPPYLASRAQWNVSPKLLSSGNTDGIRDRVLAKYVCMPRSTFKFVIVDEIDIEEISRIVKLFDIPSDRVLLMPEGTERDVLSAHTQICIDAAKTHGWRVCPRLQFEWFGNRRAT